VAVRFSKEMYLHTIETYSQERRFTTQMKLMKETFKIQPAAMCTIENNSGGAILKRDVITHNRDVFTHKRKLLTHETDR